jgi:cytochrome c-type biogenesis protein CcmH/NrfG
MNTWILALVMTTNPDGFYAQEFNNEQECTRAMHKLISKVERGDSTHVKSLSCLPAETFVAMTD